MVQVPHTCGKGACNQGWLPQRKIQNGLNPSGPNASPIEVPKKKFFRHATPRRRTSGITRLEQKKPPGCRTLELRDAANLSDLRRSELVDCPSRRDAAILNNNK